MASKQFVVFTVNNQEYGIDVETVNGILRAKKFQIKVLPGMPKSIEGIINLRGQIKYLYNLRHKFDVPGEVLNEESKFVMLNVQGSTAGWIVDEVTDIVKIDDEDMENTPQRLSSSEKNYIMSIGKVDERLIIILDPGKLLEETMLDEIKKPEAVLA